MADMLVANGPCALLGKVAAMVSLAIASASPAALAQATPAPPQPLAVDYSAPRAATLATYAKDFKLVGAVAVAFDGTHIWVARSDTSDTSCSHCVTRISVDGKTATNFPLRSAAGAFAQSPIAIAFDGVNMWTANSASNSVSRITPAGVVTHFTLPAGAQPMDIVFDGTNMWTANSGTHNVTRVTPTGVVTTFGGLPANSQPMGIAFDGANLWTANLRTNNVSRIAVGSTVTVTNFPLGANSGPRAITFDGTNLWTASNVDTVAKIDGVSGAVTTISLPGPCVASSAPNRCFPFGLAFDQPGYSSAGNSDPSSRYVWVGSSQTNNRGALMKINTATNAVAATYILPTGVMPTPRSMAFDGDHVWVVLAFNRVTRIRAR
jgi:hypothetical protein